MKRSFFTYFLQQKKQRDYIAKQFKQLSTETLLGISESLTENFFLIQKEEPILVAKIEGEDFFSLEEIEAKFGLSPTRFLNKVKSGKFEKKIDWISDELFPENENPPKKNPLVEIQEKIENLSSRVEKLEKRGESSG